MMNESLLRKRQIHYPFSHQNSPFLTSRVTKPNKRERKDKKEKVNTPNSLDFHYKTSNRPLQVGRWSRHVRTGRKLQLNHRGLTGNKKWSHRYFCAARWPLENNRIISLFIAGKAPVLTSDDVSSDRTKCRLQRKSAPLETIDFGPLLNTIKTLIANCYIKAL